MNHFMNNAKEFLNRDRLQVIIYHGGEMPNETHYTYDINGNNTMREFDSNGDGVITSRYRYTWESLY